MTIAVKRALSLLDLFTESLPEIGLSDAARLSGQDKATVHRLLTTLREAGLVEQDARSKLYRIGPGVLRLARVRERSTPLVSVLQPMLDRLTETTGETSHFSIHMGGKLVVVAAATSTRPAHVAMNKLETLPLHATASGLAFLAFCPPEIRDEALSRPMPAHTGWTLTDPAALRARLEEVRAEGFGTADRSYDEEVYGIGIPVFDPAGRWAIGAISVAAPRHRMSAEAIARLREALGALAAALSQTSRR